MSALRRQLFICVHFCLHFSYYLHANYAELSRSSLKKGDVVTKSSLLVQFEIKYCGDLQRQYIRLQNGDTLFCNVSDYFVRTFLMKINVCIAILAKQLKDIQLAIHRKTAFSAITYKVVVYPFGAQVIDMIELCFVRYMTHSSTYICK